jgi:hypothetical protein
MHVCKNGNLMRQEASEEGTAIVSTYYDNKVQPICALFTGTYFHKLFSLFRYLREKCYQVSSLVIPGNAGYPCWSVITLSV